MSWRIVSLHHANLSHPKNLLIEVFPVSVLQLCIVSHTLTIRLTPEILEWLKDTANRTGVPVGRIIRQHLEQAKSGGKQRFLRHAGAMSGPPDLSARKGFSRK